jgi:23S rRNA pseudouridine1911/1915/1917 synthase
MKPTWVLYEDNHLLVCNKPSGVLAQGDSSGDETQLDQCRQYLAAARGKDVSTVYLGLVHRIDRVTSGVILYAKTSKAAARLSADFRDRLVKKHYLCVVNLSEPENAPSFQPTQLEHMMITGSSGRVNKSLIVPATSAGAQQAQLQYQRLDVEIPVSDSRKPAQALLHVQPTTGRKHQIRAQLSFAGWPIVGDFKYDAPQRFKNTRDIALHALALQVRHPVQREQMMTFAANPPSLWQSRYGAKVAHVTQCVIDGIIENGGEK